MFILNRKFRFISLIMFTGILILGCDNSEILKITDPYTDVESGGSVGGSYSKGDELESGGDSASGIAGAWMATHMDTGGDNQIDDVVDVFAPHSKVYYFTSDYVYEFYSSLTATQVDLGTQTEDSTFYYSAEESSIFTIKAGVVTNIFTMVTLVNEVVDGTAISVLYMTNAAGKYVRLEKQANDYLP